ncbi:MAG: patatin-like phospholipase family protein [Candidatus Korobacteraceae bacterium]
MIRRLVHSVRAFRREFGRGPGTVAQAPPAIGLALGGGFARGLAHIGVLKVLEEENIPIQFVGGTSVGAIIGAAYCSGISAKEMEEIATLVRFRDFARWTLSRLGFASNDRMRTFLEKTLKVSTFEELRIPLAVTATDFVTGDAVVFRSGPLVDPVRASCAYPGIFLPVEMDDRLLVDGMLAHGVPTIPVREMGATRVIAVYLNSQWGNLRGPRHVFDVIGQCFSIAQQKMCGPWQAAADLVLTPDVRGFSYDSFERAAELRQAGEDVTRRALPAIREWLQIPVEQTKPAVKPAPAEVSPA